MWTSLNLSKSKDISCSFMQRSLTGFKNLDEVEYLEMKVDTRENIFVFSQIQWPYSPRMTKTYFFLITFFKFQYTSDTLITRYFFRTKDVILNSNVNKITYYFKIEFG